MITIYKQLTSLFIVNAIADCVCTCFFTSNSQCKCEIYSHVDN